MQLDPNEIGQIIRQIIEYAGEIAVAKVPPSQAHWVSMREACLPVSKGGLGWSETILKNGIADGRLHPIQLGGAGGTNLAVSELIEYQKWLLERRAANKLPQQYLQKHGKKIPTGSGHKTAMPSASAA